MCVCRDNKYICFVYITHDGDWVSIYLILSSQGVFFVCHRITQKILMWFIFWPGYVIDIYKLVKCLVKFVKYESSENISTVTFLYLIMYFKQVGKGHQARRYTEQIMQIVMLSSVSQSY